MSTVLIADDDQDLLGPICAYLSQRASSLQTIPATSGSECIEILKSQHVDLVLSDLRMPDGDGIDVLAYISRHNASLPVIVMSAYVDGDETNNLVKFGNLRFLSKPAGLDQIFKAIDAALRGPTELGSFNGFSLAGVLQLVEMEEKTCLLELNHGTSDRGCFAFVNGRMARAACGTIDGEDAALEMLTWEQPGIRVHRLPHSDKMEPQLSCSVTSLLMRSFQGRDEDRLEARATSAGAMFTADPGQLPDLPVDEIFNFAAGSPAMAEPEPVLPPPEPVAPPLPTPRSAPRPAPAREPGAATLDFQREEKPQPRSTVLDPVVPVATSAVYEREVVEEYVSPLPGVLLFAVITGLMVGYQYEAAGFVDFKPYYLWARNIMVLVAFSLVVADAYTSSLLHAALCVILPPYTLIYASTRVTSHVLRGLFFAALTVLALEMYFIPDDSIVFALREGMEGFFETVDRLIVRAGS